MLSSHDAFVEVVADRLRSTSVRAMIRGMAEAYFCIPSGLSDAEALDVLKEAIILVEDDLR